MPSSFIRRIRYRDKKGRFAKKRKGRKGEYYYVQRETGKQIPYAQLFPKVRKNKLKNIRNVIQNREKLDAIARERYRPLLEYVDEWMNERQ